MAYKKAGSGKSRGNSASDAPKVDKYSTYVEETSARIIALMEENKAPWQRGWDAGQEGGGMPYNATTGKAYSGYNSMNLTVEQALKGYTDDRWLTFKQALDLGCHVRKGEKGTQCVKYVELTGKKEDRQAAEAEGKRIQGRLMPVLFTVFNAQQIEGMPAAPEREVRTEHERHAECERLMADSKATIHYGGSRAYYQPARDAVQLPERDQFHSADAFYATALHELGHWTGHASRLDRDLTGQFGSPSYAREELNAEISSFMVGQRLGIGHDPSRHASYLQSWIQVVKEDPKAILTACKNAEKICEFLGVAKYEHEATQKAENTQALSSTHAATQAATQAHDDLPRPVPSPVATHAAERSYKREQVSDYGMSM